ncbi:unnamed protein product [Rhizoctonia solani]|uniref:Peptidase C14 caspase domain-containing protein n=1 Tax=Rhizoctonia solani TaxID=456999 RepID=A0A8H3HT74_9AGAM|nr:unnamed protein product [Rhizoctonia solani]
MEEYSYSSFQDIDPILRDTGARGSDGGSRLSDTFVGTLEESTAIGIINAIQNGDYSDAQSGSPTKVKRRALLVGVQYIQWPGINMELPSTPHDVWRIYNMLRDQGYEASNIRILVEGIIDDDRYNPSKSNIMRELEWLVEGAQSGDYRYFHFSGHGEAFETKKGIGKITRAIPSSRFPTRPDDPERINFQSNPTIQRNVSVPSQSIPEGEVKYYNEALITSYKMPLHEIKDPMKRQDYNRVRDNCCHSGRMIEDNNLKLLGSGFRGGLFGSGEQEVQEPLSKLIRDQGPSEVIVEDQTVHRNGSMDRQTLSVKVLATPNLEAPHSPEEPNIPADQEAYELDRPPLLRYLRQGYLTFGAPVRNYFLPPRINMVEKLPAEETNRDNIKATIMAWSGCHQRQLASDYNDSYGGYFTFAFTEAISHLRASGVPTVRMLHAEVDKRLKEAVGRRKLQYAQLWTSLGDKNEDEVRARLDHDFVV